MSWLPVHFPLIPLQECFMLCLGLGKGHKHLLQLLHQLLLIITMERTALTKEHSPRNTHQGTLTKEHSPRNTHQGTLTKEHSPRNTHQGTLTKEHSPRNTHQGTLTKEHSLTRIIIIIYTNILILLCGGHGRSEIDHEWRL